MSMTGTCVAKGGIGVERMFEEDGEAKGGVAMSNERSGCRVGLGETGETERI